MFTLSIILAALGASAGVLEPAHYKSVCPMPQAGSALFVGQGVPIVNPTSGTIDVARDIHWLSLSTDSNLVGYAITGTSGITTVVPYTRKNLFIGGYRLLNADQYIPLGKMLLSGENVTRALYAGHHLKSKGLKFIVHPCFSNEWNGKYPPGS